MKVYLLILHFCMDGTEDTCVEVFATKEKAQAQMRQEYETTLKEYEGALDDYDLLGEVSVDDCKFYEPDDSHAHLEIPSDYPHIKKSDVWHVVEQEVIGL